MIPDNAQKRKFLVVIDNTPESDRAVTFAANRVHHVGGSVVLLSVIQTQDFAQFLGVEDVMRAEAREEVERLLDARLARIASIGDIRTETVIREGGMREAIEQLVTADPGIGILVLAASSGKDGPGKLITEFAARSGGAALPVIVTIIPGTMTDAEIIAAT